MPKSPPISKSKVQWAFVGAALLCTSNPSWADTAPQLMAAAAKASKASQYGEAGRLYDLAAKSFGAQGLDQEQAKASGEAAQMYEKQADQILAGIADPAKAAAPAPIEAPANFAAPAKAHPLPVPVAKKPVFVPVAAPAPPKSQVLKLPALRAKPGYVVGRAVFANGRPIPTFTVSVAGYDAKSDNGVSLGVAGSVGFGTAHNGSYAVRTLDSFSHRKPVNALVVQISAQTKVIYKGKTYPMDLCPVDGKGDTRDARGMGQFSGHGLKRDFVLKIAGHIPGQDDTTDLTRQHAYYGQRISLDDWIASGPTLQSAAFKSATLSFSLTPQGPLLDGSTGTVIKRTLSARVLGTEGAYLLDIPIGTYSISGQIMQGGVSKPLSLGWDEGERTYGPTATLNPEPYPDRFGGTLTGADPVPLKIKP